MNQKAKKKKVIDVSIAIEQGGMIIDAKASMIELDSRDNTFWEARGVTVPDGFFDRKGGKKVIVSFNMVHLEEVLEDDGSGTGRQRATLRSVADPTKKQIALLKKQVNRTSRKLANYEILGRPRTRSIEAYKQTLNIVIGLVNQEILFESMDHPREQHSPFIQHAIDGEEKEDD